MSVSCPDIPSVPDFDTSGFPDMTSILIEFLAWCLISQAELKECIRERILHVLEEHGQALRGWVTGTAMMVTKVYEEDPGLWPGLAEWSALARAHAPTL